MVFFTQENRFISITTPLAQDELLLASFEGNESISGLFEYEVDVLSTNPAIDPHDLIGEQVTLHIHNEQQRTFNGYVSQFTFGIVKSNGLRAYRLTVVPWLWFLSKTHNQRIFQNKNAQEILTQIFSQHGFNDYIINAKGGTRPREYCIQYGETDLHFISRLLEEEGIAYYFKQTPNTHILMIVDQKTAYEHCPEADVIYSPGNQATRQLNDWQHGYHFGTGVWAINDYNFKEPSKKLLVQTPTRAPFKGSERHEHYQYPGLHNHATGQETVAHRADAEEVYNNLAHGQGDCVSFHAGGLFNLQQHENSHENGTYLITRIHHSAHDNSYYINSGSDSDTGSDYHNRFDCIPEHITYRPPQTHTRPTMKGPQTAIATGPAGDEIHVDEHGRIKAQFHWDREGNNDENSSCYLRVAQTWAGNKWGASFTPRIGHEVIVDFLDGDPDRPLVTGSVYNGTNTPPYTVKTQSGIKTRSTKGGTADHYNELRFEDNKGTEQIYLHAEKDMDIEIEHNQTLTVDNDRTKTIKHDEHSSIGNDRHKQISHNQSETIGNNKTIEVGVDHTESIGKHMTLTLGGNLEENVQGHYNAQVTQQHTLQADSIDLNAYKQIRFTTGAASLTMNSNGEITLTGRNIYIAGQGKVAVRGGKVRIEEGAGLPNGDVELPQGKPALRSLQWQLHSGLDGQLQGNVPYQIVGDGKVVAEGQTDATGQTQRYSEDGFYKPVEIWFGESGWTVQVEPEEISTPAPLDDQIYDSDDDAMEV